MDVGDGAALLEDGQGLLVQDRVELGQIGLRDVLRQGVEDLLLLGGELGLLILHALRGRASQTARNERRQEDVEAFLCGLHDVRGDGWHGVSPGDARDQGLDRLLGPLCRAFRRALHEETFDQPLGPGCGHALAQDLVGAKSIQSTRKNAVDLAGRVRLPVLHTLVQQFLVQPTRLHAAADHAGSDRPAGCVGAKGGYDGGENVRSDVGNPLRVEHDLGVVPGPLAAQVLADLQRLRVQIVFPDPFRRAERGVPEISKIAAAWYAGYLLEASRSRIKGAGDEREEIKT